MFRIISLTETGSTNDDAQAMLGEPGSAGTVLLADYQHAGRGRKTGRAWIAPPGSALLFTTILPQSVPVASLWALPFWVALAVADGIEATSGVRVALQWPNDLLLPGGKCCGILCVSRVSGDLAWVACGVGINVLRPADDGSLATVSPAPAFLCDVAQPVDRDVLLTAVLAAYERMLPMLATPVTIARAWESRAVLDGTRYRLAVDGDGAPFDAIARRISPDGSLIVVHDGRERTISLADARVVR